MKRVLIKRPTEIKGTRRRTDYLKRTSAQGPKCGKNRHLLVLGGLGKVAPTSYEEIYGQLRSAV